MPDFETPALIKLWEVTRKRFKIKRKTHNGTFRSGIKAYPCDWCGHPTFRIFHCIYGVHKTGMTRTYKEWHVCDYWEACDFRKAVK